MQQIRDTLFCIYDNTSANCVQIRTMIFIANYKEIKIFKRE